MFRKQYCCLGCILPDFGFNEMRLLHLPFETSKHQCLIIFKVRLSTSKLQAVTQSTRQAKSLFNFSLLKHISLILTDKSSHLKKSPVTRIHLSVRNSYNMGVCTHSEGQSSIRKAAKYQKYDVPHFSSTPGAKLKRNIQIVTLYNKSKPLSLYNY